MTLVLEILALSILVVAVVVWAGLWLNNYRLIKIYAHDALVFPHARSRFETVRGVNIHYIQEGDRGQKVVFLVHGLGANLYCWRFLIPLLAKHYHVLAVDLVGFGQSEKPKAGYSLKIQAQRLVQLLKNNSLSNVTVIGNSMGGAIAAEMACQAPDLICQTVMLNSAHDSGILPINLKFLRHLSPLTAPLLTRAGIRRLLTRVYGLKMEISEEVVTAYHKPYLGNRKAHEAFFKSFDTLKDHTLYRRFLKLAKPTLIIWGQNDKIIPVRWGKRLHRDLGTSHLIIHPEAGHHIQEEDPLWLFNHIHEFVK